MTHGKSTMLIPGYVKAKIRKPFREAHQEQDLIYAAQAGDADAAERLVEANIPLVAKYANQMVHSCRLPFEVLLAEGAYGLFLGIYTWKPNKGVTRLMSWAMHSVRHHIIRAIRADMSIKYPSNFYDSRRKIEKAVAQFERLNGCTPHINAIMDELGTPLLDRLRYASFGYSEVSLDSPVRTREGNDSTEDGEIKVLHDVIADKLIPSPDDNLFRREVRDAIRETLDESRDPRLATIVFYTEGLAGRAVRTRRELADALGCGPERVRQLGHKAMGIIKESRKLRELALLN